jgi:hypothetical protein
MNLHIEIRTQIPKALGQIQYDTSSQMFYLNECLAKLNLPPAFKNVKKYVDDKELDSIIQKLQPLKNTSNLK